jgi:hypothetical protein
MADTDRQKMAFEFLLAKFRAQEPFSRDDFKAAVPNWAPKTYSSYWL